VARNVPAILAIEALCAAQAIDLLAPLSPGVGTQAAHDLVRALAPQLVQDRYLAPEIEAVARAITEGRFAALLTAADA
jgi:histidine ammonia-lyase